MPKFMDRDKYKNLKYDLSTEYEEIEPIPMVMIPKDILNHLEEKTNEFLEVWGVIKQTINKN